MVVNSLYLRPEWIDFGFFDHAPPPLNVKTFCQSCIRMGKKQRRGQPTMQNHAATHTCTLRVGPHPAHLNPKSPYDVRRRVTRVNYIIQTSEKDTFMVLLADLCTGIPQPEYGF